MSSNPRQNLWFDTISMAKAVDEANSRMRYQRYLRESMNEDFNKIAYGFPGASLKELLKFYRNNKDKKEIYQNGDEIDELVYKIDKEFGLKAHTIKKLLAIYQNPKKLRPFREQVKLAKSLFWIEESKRLSANPYIPDWEEHEHQAYTLELAGFKIFEQELIDGAVSRGKVSQVLNNFKEKEKLKKQALKQFFGPKKKDLAKNNDVIEILKKAFGIKFDRRTSGYHRISDQESLSYKLLYGILKYKEHKW